MLIQKFSIGLMALLVSSAVMAEDLVPLFDDDVPNLGRNAEPLKEIHVAPSELPDVKLNIQNTEKKPVGFTKKEQKPGKKMVAPEKPGSRSIQLASETKISSQTSDRMAEQLRADMKQAQEQKEAEERAQKEAELRAAQEAEQARLQAEQAAAAEQTQPDSLTGLFRELHDVHTFDVSGFALGMTPDDVVEVAEESGYRLSKVEHGIPLHRTTFYKQNCQAAQIHRVDEINNCVIEQAQNDEMYYISSMTFEKPQTAEFIQILFTGPQAENVSYKIYYENEGDNSLGFTRKNLARKMARRDSFWNLMYETYGYPDDSEAFIWGDPQKAYMKAQMQGSNYNAYIILEDLEAHNLDLMDMDATGQELPKRHTFTFAVSEEQ